MVILSVVFGHLARLPSDGAPIPCSRFRNSAVAIVPHGVQRASISLVGTRTFSPCLLSPSQHPAGHRPELDPRLFLFFLSPRAHDVLWRFPHVEIPGSALAHRLTSLTPWGRLWLSALNVQYRDVQHAIPSSFRLGCLPLPSPTRPRWFPRDLQVLYGLNPWSG